MAKPLVTIVGAKALRHDVNRLVDDISGPLYKAMAQAGYDAVQPIVARTRADLPVSARAETVTHRPGRLAASVRASRIRTGGVVRMGSARVPWAGWVEFGGTRHRPHESYRPIVKTGRYLWPAARDLAPRAAADYAAALTKIFASPDVWTNTGSQPHD
jgi:hypothetical protein